MALENHNQRRTRRVAAQIILARDQKERSGIMPNSVRLVGSRIGQWSFDPHCRSLYVLRTHVWNSPIQRMYEQMQADLGHQRVWILCDVTHGIPDELPQTSRLVKTTEDECRAVNPLHHTSYYNAETVFLLFDEWVSDDYDYVWFIEYDVRCIGNWRSALTAAVSSAPLADWVAKSCFDPRPPPRDNADFTDSVDNLTGAQLTEIRQSLFSTVRCSRRLLQFFRNKYFGRLTAYCELLLPTVAYHHGFVITTLDESVAGAHFWAYPAITESDYFSLKDKWERDHQDPHRHSILVHPVRRSTLGNTNTVLIGLLGLEWLAIAMLCLVSR